MDKRISKRVRAWLLPFFLKLTYHDLDSYSFKLKRYIELRVNGPKALSRIPLPMWVLMTAKDMVDAQYIELSKSEELMREKAEFDRRRSLRKKLVALRAIQLVLHSGALTEEEKEGIDSLLSVSGLRGAVDNIKRIDAEIKAIDIKLKEDEGGDKEYPPATRADFLGIISFLNKEGYHITLDTPVLQYIETLNLYKQQVEAIKKQQLRSKNGRVSNK